MKRLLLDTHALIWSIAEVDKLSDRARKELSDFSNEVYVSSASAWEIATKFRLGKLPQAERFVFSFGDTLRKLGFRELPISVEHARRAGLLPGVHKDPFDRILIAQAQTEGFLLVSNEKVFDTYQIHRLW